MPDRDLYTLRGDVQDIRINEVKARAQIDNLVQNIASIKEELDRLEREKVDKSDFVPIKRIHDLVAKLIVSTVVLAVLSLIMKNVQ